MPQKHVQLPTDAIIVIIQILAYNYMCQVAKLSKILRITIAALAKLPWTTTIAISNAKTKNLST